MADISNCDESFDAKSRSKIYTRTFLEVFGAFPEEAEEVIAGVKELEAKAKSMGLDAAPTPHSPYTMSTRLLQMSAAEGLKDGFISYHNQESQEEDDLLISGTGALAENYKGRNMPTPPVTGKPALLYFINSLKEVHPEPFEESILLIHNTATNEESVDAALSTFKNVTWVTCPLSNIFIHDTLAPYDLLRSKGVRIAIGTDSLSSNHILSMAEEIKCLQQHHPEIPLTEILQWSCLNGAIALGKRDTFGSFEVGKRPGAVLIDHIDWKNFALTSKSKATRIL
jgi:cytosine/adenosine deaminase-related metal-dependent hydrolase